LDKGFPSSKEKYFFNYPISISVQMI